MSNKAFEFALEHLRLSGFHDFGAGQPFTTDLYRDKYIITVHLSETKTETEDASISFEISEEDANKLVDDSENCANAWDLARAICVRHLEASLPLPRPLEYFMMYVLLGNLPCPRTDEAYNQAYRNRVLARLIFEVWMLFDLSEKAACEILKQAADKYGMHTPSDLRDIWRKSEIKQHGLPERSHENKLLVAKQAAERLRAHRSRS